jgi:hypothetical protein
MFNKELIVLFFTLNELFKFCKFNFSFIKFFSFERTKYFKKNNFCLKFFFYKNFLKIKVNKNKNRI